MRIADYVIEKLNKLGVEHIFSVNGRGVLYLTDALAKNQDVQCVSMHHEQAAAYAAVAYAQYRDGLGACLVSTGCGSTNAITGLLCAWQDGIPCVFISGNNMLSETTRYTGSPIRTYGQQETDIISVVESLTKYSVMITDPTRIVYEVEKAIYMANEGRKGPVWIDIPLDIQDARIEPDELERYEIKQESCSPTVEDISYVAERISKSERPIILIGSGVRWSHAIRELKELLAICPIPLTYATSAVDVIGSKNDISVGTVGSMGGTRAGNFAVQNSDLLLVLGNRLSPMTTSNEYDKFAREAEIVVVDIDEDEHKKNTVRVDKLIKSDVREFLIKLTAVLENKCWDSWSKKCRHWKEVFPICEEVYRNAEKVDLYQLAEVLTETMPRDATICTDAGLEELIIPASVRLEEGQRLLHPNSQGAMGYSIPAAIGAYYAGAKNIVVVVGDGSIMMNVQEFTTIAFNNIPIKVLLINNNGYATIRKRQQGLFRRRTIGNDTSDGLGLPQFQRLSYGFGVEYEKIDNDGDLKCKIRSIMDKQVPIICEIMGVENQEYLHSSYARGKNNKIVRRPLEDQSPFLDRETFLYEMIIEPIDQ